MPLPRLDVPAIQAHERLRDRCARAAMAAEPDAGRRASAVAGGSVASLAPAVPIVGMCFGDFPITETRLFPPPPDGGRCWVYVTLNAEIALSLPQSPELNDLLATPRVRVSVDGQWLWWALRRKYPERPLVKLAGSDLIFELARRCSERHQRLLLLGSGPAGNAAAVAKLQARFPGLQVQGLAPPWFAIGGADEVRFEAEATARIAQFRPAYIVLGLGAAKEHRFAARNVAHLDDVVDGVLCFGGSIDFASGAVRRAPAVWQRLGLEGIWRVLQQPRRLWRLIGVLRILPVLLSKSY